MADGRMRCAGADPVPACPARPPSLAGAARVAAPAEPAEPAEPAAPGSRAVGSPGTARRGTLTALLTALTLVVALLGPGGQSPATAAQRSAQVTGWLASWALEDGVAAVEANPELMREASPFWFSARAARGRVVLSSGVSAARRTAIIARLRAAGVAIIPSVADGSAARAMAAVLRDPTARSRHVAQLVDLVVAGGYDGIELDYEKFAFADGTSTWAATRPAWVAFIRQLGAALHKRDKQLAVAVPPVYDGRRARGSGYWVYDYAGMAGAVDSLRIMTYDYSVSRPGPISPLSFVRRTMTYAVSAFPRERIRMGLPAYGRLWIARRSDGSKAITGTCPTGKVPGTTSFTSAKAHTYLTGKAGGKALDVRYDAVTGETVAAFTRKYKGTTSSGRTTSCTVRHEAWWVDARGVAARMPLVERYGLAGVAVWHLGGVDAASWLALRRAAGIKSPTAVVLVASPTRVGVGSALSLRARVTGAPEGSTVTLKRRSHGATTWRKVSTAKLDRAGRVTFAIRSVRTTASWRVLLDATATTAASRATVKVPVVPKVTARVSDTTPPAGSVVTVKVTVTPARKGMTVRRQVLANGEWTTLAKDRTDARGRATFRITWPQAPTDLSYRVRTSAKGGLARGTSATFRIRSR